MLSPLPLFEDTHAHIKTTQPAGENQQTLIREMCDTSQPGIICSEPCLFNLRTSHFTGTHILHDVTYKHKPTKSLEASLICFLSL